MSRIVPKGPGRIHAFEAADRNAPSLMRAFARLRRNLIEHIDTPKVRGAIANNDLRAVMLALSVDPADVSFRRFYTDGMRAMRETVVQAGNEEAERLGVDLTLKDEVSGLTERLLSKRIARLTVDTSEAERLAIRKILSRGVERGDSANRIIAALKRRVGLTDIQTEWVAKRYQAALDAGATEARADQIADRFGKQLRENRAHVISRTEMAAAQNAGLAESWNQIDRAGMMLPGAKKRWVTAMDERRSDICAELEGKVVGVNESFRSGVTGELYDFPPAHPNCRSTIVLEFND